MSYNFEPMIKDFSSLGLKLSDLQIDQFKKYYELLVSWNEKMNLTAITDFDEVCKLHFTDSITSCMYYDYSKDDLKIIDIGTGAGFPGIVLKIVFPHLNITLLDSLQKRIGFLNEVIDALSLNDEGSIETIHGRAEDYSDHKSGILREKYDIAVSRAVARFSTLCEYCMPYIKVGGSFISYKGDKAQEEVDEAKNAIFLLGGKLNSVNEFVLPDTDITRNLCIVDKVQNTSSKYPRKAGTPQKKPL